MKKTFCNILSLAVLVAGSQAVSFAQTNPNTARTNAVMSLEEYNTDRTKVDKLKSAKENIDFSADHEKTGADGKTWRYKGQIYNKIAFDSKLKVEFPDAAVTAYDAYDKALELEEAKVEAKGKPKTKIAAKGEFKSGFEEVARSLYNGGVDAYNAQRYESALSHFSSILKIKDRTAYFTEKKPINLKIGIGEKTLDMEIEAARLGGISAIQLKKPEEAEKLLMPLLKENKIHKDLISSTYSSLAMAYHRSGNSTKANKIIAGARKEYPTDQNLLITEINIALAEGKLEELEGKLKQAVEADSKNVELHFVMGNMYDEIFRKRLEAEKLDEAKTFFDKAVEWYGKAFALDAKHFNSAYSLGAIHVNYSNSFAQRMNDIPNARDPKYKELESEYNKLLQGGLTSLKAAETIKADDISVAVALKEVYGRKNDEENFMKYKKRVEELQQK
ncbi:MAG: hypothetical protein GY810_03540 [Aureispira sp.]|nr:hypothetical protein [Aureispira sp.]